MSSDARRIDTASRQVKRCGATKAGPSAEAWEAHRATITTLYRTMKWDQLDEIMREKYNFHASKRMYNQRFRQWNISKYLKTTDKDVLMQQCGNSVKELSERLKSGHINKQEYDRTLRWWKSIQEKHPARPISVPKKTISTELILLSLRNYHVSLIEHEVKGLLDGRFFKLEPTKESTNLWFGILRGVKSLDSANDPAKIAGASSEESAAAIQAQAIETNKTVFTMLRQVGALAAPAMSKRPLDFMYELLVEMSAFKSKEWPKVRSIILRLFNQEAMRVFCAEHPIAVMCRELQKEGHCTAVASVTMNAMKDICDKIWGEHSILSFKSRKAIYIATLKARDMKKAAKIGKDLLVSSQTIWGDESAQSREARFRLGQLFLIENEVACAARKEFDRAIVENSLQYYHDVIKQPPGAMVLSKSGFLEDETTLGAMADMGYLHSKCGSDTEALSWYQKAADISRRICEPGSNVQKAAIEEVIAKLREMNRLDQVAAWEEILKQSEAAIQSCSV